MPLLCNEILPNQPSRQCSQQSTKKTEFSSQLMDLQPDMLKKDFVNVPLAHSVDDLVKRLLSLEFASHREKLKLKEEQLIAKVQRHKLDRTSPEVRGKLYLAKFAI
ncbi:hypothetical protein DNTS_029894 [Danionella cerebrum]|uniref:Uncharacterized protein n=1 Tax=Danionella cerebrum TaxID=2873325 RepID=A0A553RLR3_9TELE|nr:hypothetical protein DNTS_029894 [Danionella translucida]